MSKRELAGGDAEKDQDVVEEMRIEECGPADLSVLEEAYTTGRHPDPKHPLNLPKWRKWAALISLAWSAFVAGHIAACQLPALPQIAASLDATLNMIANTVGFVLLGLAIGPLLFNPLSMTLGRRPTLIFNTALTIPCVGWLSVATSYNSFAAARILAGVAASVAQTVPAMVIADMFKKSERGDKMSLFGLCAIVAPGISPFISSYILLDKDWRWIYYLTIMFLGLQLLLFVFFLPETQYIPDPHNPSAGRTGVKYWPWQRPRDYLALTLRPIVISRFVALTVPAFYYGIVFGLSVGISVLVPGRLFVSMYGFSTQAVGIAYLAFAVGGVLGKTAGGWVGDRTVLWIQARTGERHPEYRIWAMIPLLPVLLAGFLVFGLALEHELHWMVVLVGVALDYMGLAGITGILSTYMIESYLLEPMNAMAVFQFWKCLWGFVAPLFVFQWGVGASWGSEYIAQAFIVFGLGILLCAGLIKYGERLRRAQGMPGTDNM